MPEPTEEMRQAFLDAGTLRGYGGQLEDLDAGLRAVLEIAERDVAQELAELRLRASCRWNGCDGDDCDGCAPNPTPLPPEPGPHLDSDGEPCPCTPGGGS